MHLIASLTGRSPLYTGAIQSGLSSRRTLSPYTAGAAHAAAPGIHAPIGVALTRDGEVWTWGLMLGDPRGLCDRLE